MKQILTFTSFVFLLFYKLTSEGTDTVTSLAASGFSTPLSAMIVSPGVNLPRSTVYIKVNSVKNTYV